MSENELVRTVRDDCQRLGLDVLYVEKDMSKEREDSFFYNGDILELVYENRYVIRVFATGEVAFFDENDDYHRYKYGLCEEDYDELDIHTDEELNKKIPQEKFEANNWFEFEIFDKETGDYLTDGADTIFGYLYEVLDVKYYVDFIKEFFSYD